MDDTFTNLYQFSPLKILNHPDRIGDIVNKKDARPVTLEIDLSNACNMDCIWCTYKGKLKGEILIRSLVKKAIIEGRKLGIKSVVFNGGGEPLTSPHLLYAVKLASIEGLKTALITNGSLLDKNKIKDLLLYTEFIRISLDAASEKTFDLIRRPRGGRDGFQCVLENIKKFTEIRRKINSKTEIGIGYLVSHLNIQEIEKAASLARSLGADYIQFRPVCDHEPDFDDTFLKKLSHYMEGAKKYETKKFKVIFLLHRFLQKNEAEKNYSKCLANYLTAVLCADGKVYLCCQHKLNSKFEIGDLRIEHLKSILFGRERKDLIGKIDPENCPICRYDKYNEILNYLNDKKRRHTDFL